MAEQVLHISQDRGVPASRGTEEIIADRLRAATEKLLAQVRREIQDESLPNATYRLQFHAGFTFHDAATILPYLAALGVTHVYASPYLQARPGSTHGYDIVDHNAINRELGGDEGFAEFVEGLRSHGMSHILDWVPNHMGVGTDQNLWWQDLLENGRSSTYAGFFDVDWQPLKPDLANKVLLPVLSDQFGTVLENGHLRVSFAEGAFFLNYYDRRFPLAPRSLEQILRHRLGELESRLGPENPAWAEYQSILTAIGHLPPREETDAEKLVERRREKEVVKRRLGQLCEQEPAIQEFIEANVSVFNGRPGDRRSFDLLDELLQDQAYRLCYWRVAADEINYRRFFDVNELAAICMERPEVFDAAHSLVLRLLDEGQLYGLRIDHADGLYDPTGYLWQLQERRILQRCRRAYDRAVDEGDIEVVRNGAEIAQFTWEQIEPELRQIFAGFRSTGSREPLTHSLYLVVEKILESDEQLPDEWPIHGSTGYEFLNLLNALFVDRTSVRALDAFYAKFIGKRIDYSELVRECKRLIMKVSMSSELNVLGHQLDRISEKDRSSRDFTLNGLIYALRELVACFPVYRTYTDADGILDRDRLFVEQAVARAMRHNPAVSRAVFDFIRDVLLLRDPDEGHDTRREEWLPFVGRFQQFTGPMMAKAVEDTAFYVYHRLVSLNEVGGSPEHFGTTVAAFHRQNQERRETRPHALLAASTHDTKRSEDVRARVNVLSEVPREWNKRVMRWAALNRNRKTQVDGEAAPGRNDEYLLYQTLIGTWPWESPRGDALATYTARIQAYMLKAVREAKVHTSWIAPYEQYERALSDFVTAILDDRTDKKFLLDFESFAHEVAHCGLWSSLSQTLLKLTSPGVPDIYQGTELWDFSLVDPDNRRPVDYALRCQLLRELIESSTNDQSRLALAEQLLSSASDGRIKLYVIARTLDWRREQPELFTVGSYLPLVVQGSLAEHACAFARQHGSGAAVVVVPRLTTNLASPRGAPPLGSAVWGETRYVLSPEVGATEWRNVFTGESVRSGPANDFALADVFARFPVALLRAVA